MVIHNFSKKIINSRILDTYVAAVFFATLIFFVLNAAAFKPIEIIIGVVLVTTAFKGIANVMFSLIISFVDFDKTKDVLEFEKSSDKLESLIKDLAIKEATVKSAKNKNLDEKKIKE